MGSGTLVDHFPIAAVPTRNGELIVELGAADVEGPVSFPAGPVGQGAGQKCFTRAGGADNDDVLGITRGFNEDNLYENLAWMADNLEGEENFIPPPRNVLYP